MVRHALAGMHPVSKTIKKSPSAATDSKRPAGNTSKTGTSAAGTVSKRPAGNTSKESTSAVPGCKRPAGNMSDTSRISISKCPAADKMEEEESMWKQSVTKVLEVLVMPPRNPDGIYSVVDTSTGYIHHMRDERGILAQALSNSCELSKWRTVWRLTVLGLGDGVDSQYLPMSAMVQDIMGDEAFLMTYFLAGLESGARRIREGPGRAGLPLASTECNPHQQPPSGVE
jgi:hypothetical protein